MPADLPVRRKRTADMAGSYDWTPHLTEPGFCAAPVSCFKHVSFDLNRFRSKTSNRSFLTKKKKNCLEKTGANIRNMGQHNGRYESRGREHGLRRSLRSVSRFILGCHRVENIWLPSAAQVRRFRPERRKGFLGLVVLQ